MDSHKAAKELTIREPEPELKGVPGLEHLPIEMLDMEKIEDGISLAKSLREDDPEATWEDVLKMVEESLELTAAELDEVRSSLSVGIGEEFGVAEEINSALSAQYPDATIEYLQ